MDKRQAMIAAGALALVGAAAAGWSVARYAGGQSRTFGRLGVAESPPGPPGDEGERELAVPWGAGGMTFNDSGGRRIELAVPDDGFDESSLSFPVISDTADARVMLDELRSVLSSRAPESPAYRTAPPLAKQRFAEEATRFFTPYILDEERESESEESSAYFGRALTLASMDTSSVRVRDARDDLSRVLPPELLEGLRDDGGGGQREMRMEMTNNDGGETRRMVSHPMADPGAERPEGVPRVEVMVPVKPGALDGLATGASVRVSMWWDDTAKRWQPETTTLVYRPVEGAPRGELREIFQ